MSEPVKASAVIKVFETAANEATARSDQLVTALRGVQRFNAWAVDDCITFELRDGCGVWVRWADVARLLEKEP